MCQLSAAWLALLLAISGGENPMVLCNAKPFQPSNALAMLP